MSQTLSAGVGPADQGQPKSVSRCALAWSDGRWDQTPHTPVSPLGWRYMSREKKGAGDEPTEKTLLLICLGFVSSAYDGVSAMGGNGA